MTSCGVDELSHEWDEKSQGVFSWFLSEALSGHCSPNPDGKLTIERIYEWVHEKVTNWAANHRCTQTPKRFYHGSGTIALVENEPDHKAMKEQMQQKLAAEEKELLRLRLEEVERQKTEFQSGKIRQEIIALADEIISNKPRLTGNALQKHFIKQVHAKFPYQPFEKKYLSQLITEHRELASSQAKKEKEKKKNIQRKHRAFIFSRILLFTRKALLLLVLSGVLVFVGVKVYLRTTYEISNLKIANEHLQKNKPEIAMDIAGHILLPWNYAAKAKCRQKSLQLIALNEGIGKIKKGDSNLIFNYLFKEKNDGEFSVVITKLLHENKYDFRERAEYFYENQQFLKASSICRLFPDDVQFKTIYNDAKKLSLQKSREASNNGDFGFIENVEGIFGASVELEDLLYKAHLVAAKPDDLKTATSAANRGEVNIVYSLYTKHKGDNEFQLLYEKALQNKTKFDDLNKAKKLSASGDVNAVRKLAQKYYGDANFTELVRMAENKHLREQKINEAKQAALQGDVDKVKLIGRNYPSESELVSLENLARKNATKNRDFSQLQVCIKNNDIIGATKILQQYKNDSKFRSVIEAIKRDGDYYYLLGSELEETQKWKNKKIKLSGHVTSIKRYSNNTIKSVKLITIDQTVIMVKSSEPFSNVFEKNKELQDHEITVWGFFTGLEISDLQLVATNERCSLAEVEKRYIAANKALAERDFNLALNLQSPFYGPKWRKLAVKTSELEREYSFELLPKKGQYTVVTGKQLSMFAESLNNRKVCVKGVLLSDILSYGFANGYNISKASFETKDGVRINGGIYFKSRSRISKGTYVALYGLFQRKEGFFSVKWKINPVDKLQLIEDDY